jgi:hypothetical protein
VARHPIEGVKHRQVAYDCVPEFLDQLSAAFLMGA